MYKRVLTMLLCVLMVVSLVTVQAFATEVTEPVTEVTEEVTEAATEEATEEATEAITEEVTETATEAAAEEVVAEQTQQEKIPASNWREEGGRYYFSTFADLKELIQQPHAAEYVMDYEGDGDLVITEDFTLPKQMCIFMMEEESDYHPKLVIAEGVTMNNLGDLSLDGLTVNGTLTNEWWTVARENLTVNGKLENAGELLVTPECVVAGEENITNVNERNHIAIEWVCNTGEDLVAAAKRANELSSKWCVYISLYPNDAPITLTEHITLPAYSSIVQYNHQYPIVIAQGGKLTVEEDGYVNPSGNWTIQGQIENNGRISVWHDTVFAFEAGSSYSGSGVLEAYGKETSTPYYTEVLPGLNYEAFDIQKRDEAWILRSTEGLEKLGAPTDLTWGKAYTYSYESQDMKLLDQPGYITWKNAGTHGDTAQVCIYKEDGTLCYENEAYVDEQNEWSSTNLFVRELPESGKYYFTVQYITYDENYLNGAVVTSDMYSYTKPTKKMATPTNLRWTKPEDYAAAYSDLVAWWDSDARITEVLIYAADSLQDEPEMIAEYGCEFPMDYTTTEGSIWLQRELTDKNVGKYLSFKVRAITNDAEKYLHSEWSELSEPYYFTKNKVTKLSKPTKVNAVADDVCGLPVITWKAVANADAYNIYRATSSSGTYKKINNDPVSGTGYLDDTAKVGKKYYYKVEAVAGDVVSKKSDYDSVTCKCAQPAVEVSITTSSGKAKLSWGKVAGAEKYYVYRSTKKTSGFERIKSTTKAYFTDSDAKVGTTYYYKVKAISDDANSAYSNCVSAKRVCAQPELTVKISSSSGKPKLSWDKVTGATEYQIYRAALDNDTGAFGAFERVKTTTSTSYTDNKAEVDTNYRYYMIAVGKNSSLNSIPSEYVNCTCVCAQVEGISVKTDKATGKPAVSWKSVTGATGYEIYRATSKSGKYTNLGSTQELTFLDDQAVVGKSYYYKVRAVSSAGEGSYCAPAKGVCKCPTPDLSVFVGEIHGQARLEWKKVSGAKMYAIYRSTKANSDFKRIKTTTRAFYTDENATIGTTYYYKIKAIASSNTYNSGYSATVKAKRVCAQTNVRLTNASSGKPKVTWDKISGAKAYRLSIATYDPQTGEYGDVTTVTTTSTSYTHKKAVTGVTYSYSVKVLGSKSGTDSIESDAMQITCLCAAPKITVKTDANTGKPVISWNENEEVHWYRVYRSTKSGSGYTIVGGGFTYDEKFVDNTATAGKKYYYQVVPVDTDMRCGMASDVVSCYADCAKPVVEASLSKKKPKLSWEKVEGASKYEVYRSTKKSSGFKKIKTTTSTSYTDKSATTGKTYYYKIKAIASKSSANSAYSSVLKVTKSTKVPGISGTWTLNGLTTSAEELDKVRLVFGNGTANLSVGYYAQVPEDQVQNVLATGLIQDGDGALYCNDLTYYKGKYYYSTFGGYTPGTYTESGDTVTVTLSGEYTGTLILKKVSPGKYTVAEITGILHDDIVTDVIKNGGVFTKG